MAATIERRLSKLERDRAVLLALSKPQELIVVQLDKVDYNAPTLPVLLIYPGLLERLYDGPTVDLRGKG